MSGESAIAAAALMNDAGWPMPDLMKGDAAMIQGTIELVLLMGLVGLIWVIVLDILGGNHHTHDKRIGSASPEPHDGEASHDGSSRQSNIAA